MTVSQPVASGALGDFDAGGGAGGECECERQPDHSFGRRCDTDAASTVNAGAGLITVNGNGNAIDLSGTLTTNNATGSAVQIINGSTVDLGTTSATSGGLDVAGVSGNVTQNAGTAVSVDTLAVSTGGSITLGNNNNIGTVGGISSNGGLLINDVSGGLVLSGPITGGAGDDVTISTDGGGLSIQTDITGGAVRLSGDGITQTLATRLPRPHCGSIQSGTWCSTTLAMISGRWRQASQVTSVSPTALVDWSSALRADSMGSMSAAAAAGSLGQWLDHPDPADYGRRR